MNLAVKEVLELSLAERMKFSSDKTYKVLITTIKQQGHLC